VSSCACPPHPDADTQTAAAQTARARRALAGIGFVAAAVACFAALDTSTKFVSMSVPVAMVMWTRFLFQAVVTTATLLPHRGLALVRTARPGLQVLRGVTLLSCSVFAYFSLRALPVGEFTALVMLTPLVMTLVAATSLGERVSLVHWLCVTGGFAGTLLVIQPGADFFHWAMLLPLALVAANTAYQVLTARLVQVDDAGTLQFYTGWVGALLATAALPPAWQPLPWTTWALLALMGLLGSAGHYLLILAFQRAPVSVLTPFLYLQIVFAMAFGWLAFGHTPNRWATLGIVVIAVCGAGGTRRPRRAPVQSCGRPA
jgi:drug/metabolite transporter (DMT)-like permease